MDDTTQRPEKKGGFKRFLRSRKARHGTIAAVIVIIVTALVVILNIVTGLLVERFPELKVDFTSNNAYALQEDTTDYLSHLNKDVKLYILAPEQSFTGNGEYFVQAKNLIEKMQSCSGGRLQAEYVDTTKNPSFTSKYKNIDWTSTQNVALVECGDQYKALTLEECFTYDSTYASYGYYEYNGTTIEQAVVTAVLNVTTDDKVVVDILTGQQEGDYSAISSLLNNNAYQVNEISLLTGELDKDAKFLLLYAPAVDLDDDAAQKIADWLDNGGKYGRTLIYVPSVETRTLPNIDALLADWSLSLSEGYVFETSSDHLLNGGNQFTFIADYTEQYTSGLKNPNIPVVTFQSRGVTIADDSVAHALLKTSDRAGIVPYEPAKDWNPQDAVQGEPIAVAAEAVKGSEAQSRVMVFGSDMMLSTNFMKTGSFNNAAYLMNIFNTVAQKDSQSVTIESKKLDSAELGVTDAATGQVMMIFFVIVIPFAVLITGLVVWLRRRNK